MSQASTAGFTEGQRAARITTLTVIASTIDQDLISNFAIGTVMHSLAANRNRAPRSAKVRWHAARGAKSIGGATPYGKAPQFLTRRVNFSEALVVREATQLDRLPRRYYWRLNRHAGGAAGEVRSRTALIEVAIGEVQSSDRSAKAAVVDLLHPETRRKQ